MTKSEDSPWWCGFRSRLQALMPIIVLVSVVFSFIAFGKATQVSNRQIAQQRVELQHQSDNQKFLTDTFCGLVIPIGSITPTTPAGAQIREAGANASARLQCPPQPVFSPFTTVPPSGN